MISEDSEIELCSEDLASKHGFSDGDLLRYWAWDNMPEDFEWPESPEPSMRFDHLLLIELVKSYLLPKIVYCPPVSIIHSIHNPIRWEKPGRPDKVGVVVSKDEILKEVEVLRNKGRITGN